MSLNFADARITPNTVSTGSRFVLSVRVWDDDFEFGGLPMEYDTNQGFADEAQTIGGKLVALPEAPYR